MRTFTDNAGRTWTVAINVALVKRVRGVLDLDLFKLLDDGARPLGELLGDPVRLADVLFCLCKEEAEKRAVSDEDFGAALAGDAIGHAADAFVDELVDFFPHARGRESLKKLIAASRTLTDKLLDHAEMKVGQIDLEAEASRLIGSFGSSPGSSASTPGPSPSASSS
ncbi:MAG: hypothetical protein KatS3mg108_3886 [Isosphaeraceae bacterium]|nr:MAG: hypothetical protein KatS3mg108_3886 [Isosphaeraceae bacterium]